MHRLPSNVTSKLGALCLVLAASCAVESPAEELSPESDDALSSNQQSFYSVEISAELTGEANVPNSDLVLRQLLYTVGVLNAYESVANIGTITLKSAAETPLAGGMKRLKYVTRLQVAWAKARALPSTFA